MRQKSVTVKEIQKLDKIAIEQYGIPSLVLMENAGRSVAREIVKQLGKNPRPRVCVLCGSGNNAGDGFVIARQLIGAKIKTKVYLIGTEDRLKHDAAVNYDLLKKLKCPVKEISEPRQVVVNDIKRADVVVDAIFGVGLNRKITEPFYGMIQAANAHAKRIVAVDIPSGLDGTTGKIYGICIKADTTVTFSFCKRGFQKAQGPRHAGRVIVTDIGIPAHLKARLAKPAVIRKRR
jgi:NAD(P)H-hydrate epimerase